MTARWGKLAIGVAGLAATAMLFGACGDDDDKDEGGGVPAENVVAPAGYRIEIESAELPADATANAPVVTFRVTEGEGTPIDDLPQRIQNSVAPRSYPYVNAPTFTLARLLPEGEYHSLYLNLENPNAPAGTQATGVGIPTSGAGLESLGDGRYRYTFQRALGENPTAEERARTHTVGVYSGLVPEEGAEEQPASATFSFVPAGGNPELHQVVALDACNTCHQPAVRAHGRRVGVQLCLTCHTPQTTDPQTGNSVEFAEMVHKIHYGGDRPGEPYEIIGFGGSVHTYDKSFINDVRNCQLCHQGEDAERHVTVANQQSCTTCHSNVQFGGFGGPICDREARDEEDCAHPSPIPANIDCNACHTPDAIRGAHVPLTQLAQRFGYEIQDVTVGDDRVPTVRFRVLDTTTNQPRDLATDPAYDESGSSLTVMFSWPSAEYTNQGSGATSPGQPVRVAAVSGGNPAAALRPVEGQTGVYEVTSSLAVPEGVTSATVHLEGHPVLNGEELPVVNAVRSFAVGAGPVQERRQVVAVESCNACHGVVSAHGRNRNGSVQTCVVCHNPKATDVGRRGTGSPGAGQPEEPIDFKVMIHEIHAADIRQDTVTIYGFGNTAHTFPGELPGGVGNCNMCHVNNSWQLPLSDVVLDTVVDTSGTPADQSDDVMRGRVRMVCSSCHDQTSYTDTSLPACNTLVTVNGEPCLHSGGFVPGGPTDDASCADCHGPGGLADIATRHPIQ